jgi:anti-sigma B factor antagonist
MTEPRPRRPAAPAPPTIRRAAPGWTATTASTNEPSTTAGICRTVDPVTYRREVVSGLRLAVTREPVRHVIAVTGDLDHHTSPLLRDVAVDLLAEHPADLVLDLARADVLGCAAIIAIADLHHAAATVGAAVTLANVPPFAFLVLTLVGIDQIVTVHPHPAAVPAQAA